jgi:hypothetical protein
MQIIDRLLGAFWASPVAGFWTSIRAALLVGLPSGAEDRVGVERVPSNGGRLTHSAIRSMDDYAGYHTSNGLGSLDVGGGSSRWGE